LVLITYRTGFITTEESTLLLCDRVVIVVNGINFLNNDYNFVTC